MGKTEHAPVRVQRELAGEPYAIDGLSVRPVVRVDGVLAPGPQPAGGRYESGFLRLRPERVEVRAAGSNSGEVISIATPDIHEQIERNMAIAAALVALTAVILMLLRRLRG